MRLNQITAPARDLAASIAFYELMGLKLIVENDHYARFELPEGEATFSLHSAPAAAAENAPILYFECDDVDMAVAHLEQAGVAIDRPPVDQSWLWREAHLRDPAGNAIILYHAGENRTHPPWRIEWDAREIYILVVCEAAIHLVKQAAPDDAALAARFAGFKTALGPWRLEDAFDYVRFEWPALFLRSRAAIKAFAAAGADALTL